MLNDNILLLTGPKSQLNVKNQRYIVIILLLFGSEIFQNYIPVILKELK